MINEKKEKVFCELIDIAQEVITIFHASQQIQKGIGVYPVVKHIRSGKEFQNIKLNVKKNDYTEYLTANATGKIQWRAEDILFRLKKVMELLELDKVENSDLFEHIEGVTEYIEKKCHPILTI